MKRNQKISKIVNELSYFLLEEYNKEININIKNEEESFTINFKFVNGDISQFINLIKPSKDPMLEEYGSFLVGESDDNYDFELLSSMIDEYNVYKSGDYIIMEVKVNE